MILYGICKVEGHCVCGLCAGIVHGKDQKQREAERFCNTCNEPLRMGQAHRGGRFPCGCRLHNGLVIEYCETHQDVEALLK